MNAHFKYPFLVSLLVVLLVFWGLNLRQGLPRITLKNASEKTDDLRISDLRVQIFDIEGHEVYALKSTHLEHIPSEEKYYLTSPHLHVNLTDKPHWHITSEKAIILEQSEEIQLEHHVQLEHASFREHAAGKIETEQLIFYPKKNYAMTTQPIAWHQEHNAVFSQGMRAYLDENKIELFHAKAIYDAKT
jgi:lipopolysaccharide export system protein LptC